MFSIFQVHIAKDAKFVTKDNFEKVVDTLIFKRTERWHFLLRKYLKIHF